MQLQYCQTAVQRKFYQELDSTLQPQPVQQPVAPKKAPSGSPWFPLGFCLGSAGFSAVLTLSCRVICELTAWLNLQDVLIY